MDFLDGLKKLLKVVRTMAFLKTIKVSNESYFFYKSICGKTACSILRCET